MQGNKLIILKQGIQKEINLRQNHIALIMECLRLREEENTPYARKVSVRKSRQVRSQYSALSNGQDEIGDLLKKVERNLLESFNEKVEDITETLSSLSYRMTALESRMCGEKEESQGDTASSSAVPTAHWKNLSNRTFHPSMRKHTHSPHPNQALGNNKPGAASFVRHSQPILRHSQQRPENRNCFTPQPHPTEKLNEATQTAQPHPQVSEESPDPSLLQEKQEVPSVEKPHKIQFEMAPPQRSISLPSNKDEEKIGVPNETKAT